MKVDESCINHNALRLIEEIVTNAYDVSGGEVSDDHWRLMVLGEISGIIDLARALKEVLEV